MDPGTAAVGLSIASAGLGASSSVVKGEGAQASNNAQADRLERAAQFGRLQANLTDAVDREQLNTTLGNIDVIRAAAHDDPTSPTGAAIRDRETMISDRQRTSQLLNIRSQVQEEEDSADFLRKSGDFALLQGYLGGATSLGSAFAKQKFGKGGGDGGDGG